MVMARDPDGLRVRKWATSAAALAQTAESAGLVRADGWPAAYGVDQFPELETFNGILLENTALLEDLARSGALLPWDDEQPYEHVAHVIGSNGDIYRSVQDSLNEDPTADSNNTNWLPVAFPAPATVDELESGTSNSLFLAPARLLGALFKDNVNARWRALTNRFGLVKRASSTQVQNRQGDNYVAAEDLPASSAPPNSSTTARGIIRTATQSEADAGTATGPAMTPALTQRQIDATLEGSLQEILLYENAAGLPVPRQPEDRVDVLLNDDIDNYDALYFLAYSGDMDAHLHESIKISTAFIPSSGQGVSFSAIVATQATPTLFDDVIRSGARILQMRRHVNNITGLIAVVGITYGTP